MITAQWGNFKIGYMNNELAQVDRGLYGGNVHYQSDVDHRHSATSALPLMLSPQNQALFRAVKNSAAPAVRFTTCNRAGHPRRAPNDCASNCATRPRELVTGVVNLTPVMDYDIDYLQGRVLLSSTARIDG